MSHFKASEIFHGVLWSRHDFLSLFFLFQQPLKYKYKQNEVLQKEMQNVFPSWGVSANSVA